MCAGKLPRIWLSMLALFVMVLPAAAELGAGIQGTIKDPTGAVIPGATVTATKAETGVDHTAKTSGDGFYRISELAPGNYKIKVEAKGFKTTESKIQVTAEAVAGFNAELQPGGGTETVTVSGAPSPIDTESGNVSRTLPATPILPLPLRRRAPYQFRRLPPAP